ncbi:Dehydrodolichyl diphosphate synthase complex subunit NUS1 [Linum grandiflorum]
MDCKQEVPQVSSSWIHQIGNLGLRLLWGLVHLLLSIAYLGVSAAEAVESYLISSGWLTRYRELNIGKLKYLAIVIESDDAVQISKIVQLVRWLQVMGVKQLCLYDALGVLKKSKDKIVRMLDNAVLLEELDKKELLETPNCMTLEFASMSDGKEAVAKAANLLFTKYTKVKNMEQQDEQIFNEANITEALRAVGCMGPEPDLLLVYAPVRCHLGFPAWRTRYTEIEHMGSLKSMKHGSLIKAIYRFTRVRQNYGNIPLLLGNEFGLSLLQEEQVGISSTSLSHGVG